MFRSERTPNATLIVDTDRFLTELLPVSSGDIDAVLGELNSNGTYAQDPAPRWNSFPTSPNTDEDLPTAFIGGVTAVLAAYRKLRTACSTSSLSWIQRPRNTRESSDQRSIKNRPDVVAALGYEGDANLLTLSNEIVQLEDEIRAYYAEDVDTPEYSDEPLYEMKEDLKKKIRLWWLRVCLPVAFQKTCDQKSMLDGVTQLRKYMERILQEQLDRRFALGILVCGDELSVWQLSRSGLLGTKRPINIHVEPRKFIQVIMALASLSPERLGWDRTMRLYRVDERRALYSTEAGVRPEDYSSSLRDTRWLIQVPNCDGMQGCEIFVTTRMLNTPVAMAHGPATVVWHAVNTQTGERLVLKHAWREETSPREDELLGQSDIDGSHICDIVRSVDVGISQDPDHPDWNVDDTEHAIGRGLMVEDYLYDDDEEEDADISSYPQTKYTRSSALGLHVAAALSHGKYGFIFRMNSWRPPINHILTRTLMRTYGWPIKFFKDIPELVGTIRDAIQGHRDLWLHDILHRDISMNNILICPKGSDVHNTSGCLIDFGDATKATKLSPIPRTLVEPDDADFLHFLVRRSATCREWQVTLDQSAAEALVYRYPGEVGHAVGYLRRVLDTWILPERPNGRQLSVADIFTESVPEPTGDVSGHDHMNALLPSREEHMSQSGERAGTTAFMSYEILSGRHYDCTSTLRADGNKYTVTHSAIHDLESFFWVLVYLCVSRKGPGGARHDELDRNWQDTSAEEIRAVVYCLFDSDDTKTLADNKRLAFHNPEDFDKYIFPCFHPYFEPLKPLLSTWWKVIQLGYFSYDAITQTFIHQRVLNVLDEFLKTFVPEVPSPEAEKATEEELQRRRSDLDLYCRNPMC
ncbi:hypothetical protein DENSPDRAFT_872739 [Dentipellis sp. KUC8613]|nr:hypothetical protein DENSPDRAFT_872739 [Dentipellis sp. KUC8613]